ncbi:MAG TPA: acyl-CoA dehydrogenase family protein [Candidatus Acidoferrales bacterium]|nr:acyl-CoA dehydrogenase family protein [Candidatus Acidoferrales bacterium]
MTSTALRTAGATIDEDVLAQVRRFAETEVRPVAHDLEARNEYPSVLVARMREMGLFGAIIPEEYGGAGLNVSTYAAVIEEIARVWMSITGVLNSHLIMCYDILTGGTERQRRAWLPALSDGAKHGGIMLSEPEAGSDLQAIRVTARRDGDSYLIRGTKMWVTNGRTGNTFLVLAKTDPAAEPRHRGISLFIVEKDKGPGFTVSRDIDKLGYRALDTCEVVFDDYRVPAENLLGEQEGLGFKQIMSGLELGRINIAARGVGIAQAALDEAVKYSQQRETFGKPIWQHQAIALKLADMVTSVSAARLLTYAAAERKDLGERCDMEAGMAKLFATETAMTCALESMRIHGGYGYTKEFDVERFFRDVPLLIIGEGTNEIQKTIIARQLVERNSIS